MKIIAFGQFVLSSHLAERAAERHSRKLSFQIEDPRHSVKNDYSRSCHEIMAEEKEISVEKELKDRVNQIAAKLSNEHNVITLRGEKDSRLRSLYLSTEC